MSDTRRTRGNSANSGGDPANSGGDPANSGGDPADSAIHSAGDTTSGGYVDVAAWLELLRISALVTVPGDALAGASALSLRPNRGTALAVASSLCLYEAGMALNDWADRAEDARDRPHRPIPSGRITPPAALAAACALSAAGLALARLAGRPTLTVATAITATVWAYDLSLKHTALGPATMATARSLDLLMGATATASATAAATATTTAVIAAATTTATAAATAGSVLRTGSAPGPSQAARAHPKTPEALAAVALLGAHIYAVTEVSRHEVSGGSTTAPLAALGAVAAIAVVLSRSRSRSCGPGAGRYGMAWQGAGWSGVSAAEAVPSGAVRSGVVRLAAATRRRGASPQVPPHHPHRPQAPQHPQAPQDSQNAAGAGRLVALALAASYVRTAARPLLHSALNPSPPLTQRAVGGGIRALIPLQGALAARSGAAGTGAALLALAPLARRLARKVSPT